MGRDGMGFVIEVLLDGVGSDWVGWAEAGLGLGWSWV